WIGEAEKNRSLYKLTFKNGKVVEKTGIGWLFAVVSHAFYSLSDITFGTKLLDTEERQVYKNLFNESRNYCYTNNNPQTLENKSLTVFNDNQSKLINKVKNQFFIAYGNQSIPKNLLEVQQILKRTGLINADLSRIANPREMLKRDNEEKM